jgi:hypothetical protein
LSQSVSSLSIANGQFIFIRFIHSGGSNSDNLGWDDVTFTPTLAATPVLIGGTLTGFGSICTNTTAGPNSFTLTGSNLTGATVTVGPLTGYTFSTSSSGPFTASVSPSYTAPTLSTTIYVDFTPTLVQSYSGNIPASGGGASTINIAATGSGVNNIAPTVTSGAASSITATTASVAGTISYAGCTSISAYGIEYSTTSFTNGTGTHVNASNLSSGNFSSALSGLAANTLYYYHAYATNSGGTGYGAELTFTTSNLSAPVATAATSVTSASFTANWGSVAGATGGYLLDVSTLSTFSVAAYTTIGGWSFPVSGTTVTPDVASANNTAQTLTTNGGTIGTVAGATTQAATANQWQSGANTDYWQVTINSTGFYNLRVSSKQQSSNTGPRDFKVQYQIGAGAWTDVTGGTITVAANFTTGVVTNLSLPSACDNQTSIGIRWLMTSNTSVNAGTVASGGTSRIDDIVIDGNAGSFLSGYNSLAVGGTSSPVSGLTPNHTYYYRVRATSASSTSSNSNTITTVTSCPTITTTLSSQTNASCFGNANGAIDITPSGGASPYTTSGTGPIYTLIVQTKNHSHPYFGTGSAFGYTLNGVQGKELTFVRGITYSFSVLAPGHPVVISSSSVGGSANTASVITSGVTNSGTTSGTLTFTPNATTPALVYYQCNVHANMGYKIHIVDQLTDGDLSSCMAGSYSLTLTDANGCTSSPALSVTLTEPAANTFYYDGDNDGYGLSTESALACTAPTGFVNLNGDCNDANNAVHPGATEICNNGIDDNCDGINDASATANAGADQALCTGATTVLLSGAFGGSASSATWSTSGDGTFNSTTSMTATYTLGTNDLSTGSVTLTLTTNTPPGTCGAATDNMLVTIGTPPTASLNTSSNATCYGNSDGTISLNISGGTSPYTISGTGPVFTVIADLKNHAHPYFGTGISTAFIIDGTQGKELTLIRGVTYAFSVFVPGHAFFISTEAIGGGAGTAFEVTSGVVNSMVSSGTLYFTPNATHPSLLYYQCAFHSYMGWKIHIVDPNPTSLGNCMAGSYSLTVTDVHGCSSSPVISATITEPAATTFYYDNDLDNYGTPDEVDLACSAPTGFVAAGGDCDDNDNTIHPNAIEICDNSVDENCDGILGISAIVHAGSDQTICATGTATMTGSYGGATLSTTWTTAGDGTFDDASLQNAIYTPGTNDKAAGSVILTITTDVPLGGCGAVNADMTLAIEPVATVNAGSNQTICATSSASLSGSYGGNATGAVWSTSGNGTFNPNNTTMNASYIPGSTDITNGSATLTLTSTGSVYCSAAASNITITIYASSPSQPAAVTGAPASACPTATGIVLTTASDPNAQTYAWSAPGGASSGVTFTPPSNTNTQTISLGTTANSTYTIRVTATNVCGTSPFRSVGVRRTVSTPASVIGPATVCGNISYAYSTAIVGGADSYIWTGPLGCLIDGNASPYTTTNTSVSILMPNGFVSGVVSVSSHVACYTSPAKSLSVSTSAPVIGILSGTSFAPCPSSLQTYSVPAANGIASYAWTLPSGASGISTINSINVTFGSIVPNGANICVTATSVCGVATTARCKSVISGSPPVPASISGPANGLCGQIVSYNAPSIANVSYNWILPLGASGSSTINSISVTMPSNLTTAQLCVRTLNACGYSNNRCISVKGAPNTPGVIVSNPTVICPNTPGVVFNANVSGVTGFYNLLWTYPASATYVSGQGTSNLILDWGAVIGNVNLTASNTCGQGTRTFAVTFGCRQGDNTNTYTSSNGLADISIYPNPTSDILNIDFSASQKENCSINLVDITGKSMQQSTISALEGFNHQSMEISRLAKGIYMLIVKTKEGNSQNRIVIQ